MKRNSEGSAVYALVQQRLNRRDILVGGSLLAFGGSVACSGSAPDTAITQGSETATAGFAPIAGSGADAVVVPDGFTYDVLMRWGDPVVGPATGIDMEALPAGALFETGAGRLQATAFGTSCDGMGVVALDGNRLVLCINHETPEMSRMFPGWRNALRERTSVDFIRNNPESVAVMRASVGVSILEFEQTDNGWRIVADSGLNRRVTADTPIEFSGPAANHPWLGGSETEVGRCEGTLGNCAAGTTPWGTYLTAEENTQEYFGNGAAASLDPLLERASQRFGMRRGPSAYRWEAVDERFDNARDPTEPLKFGWIVEIDPLDPSRPIRKRTALGRFRHEGATTTLSSEGRPVVYLGDDSTFEYFYKFVSEQAIDPENPGANDGLLDDGRLYVAKLYDDGSGEWLPLVFGERPELTAANGFRSQADVVLRCREAADLLGATPLDRPEDVAVHPHNGRVYLACTQGLQRGGETARRRAAPGGGADPSETPEIPGVDAANPRGPNPFGHILEFVENYDAASERFRWEVFILAGDPAAGGLAAEAVAGRMEPAAAYYAGRTDATGLSAFACPDNLGFDLSGNLWIVTDGSQPDSRTNNGCFVCPTEGPERGAVRQFMSGPVGAEICGCTFSPDGETLFLTVQHPGSGSSIAAPSSHWPDGGESQPRSSLIAVRAVDSSVGFSV